MRSRSAFRRIAGQVGRCGVSAWFQPCSSMNKILRLHIAGEGISTWFRDLARDFHRRSSYSRSIAMNQQAIARVQQNIVSFISLESLAEIDAEDSGCAVEFDSEQLRRVHGRIWSKAASQIDGIAKPGLTGRRIGSGRAHFPADPDGRSGLEIEPAEDSYSVEGRKLRSGLWSLDCRGKIEADHARTEVRRFQTYDLRVMCRWLGQQVFVGCDQVGEFHALAIGVAAGTKYVPLQVDGLFVVGRDGKDMDFIAISNLKRGQLRI